MSEQKDQQLLKEVFFWVNIARAGKVIRVDSNEFGSQQAFALIHEPTLPKEHKALYVYCIIIKFGEIYASICELSKIRFSRNMFLNEINSSIIQSQSVILSVDSAHFHALSVTCVNPRVFDFFLSR